MVDLPFVPVTPATCEPLRRHLRGRRRRRPPSPPARPRPAPGARPRRAARSTTRAAAPAAIASWASACPSTVAPGTQKKSAPRATARVSWARSEISTRAAPITSVAPTARVRTSSCIRGEGYRRRSRPGAYPPPAGHRSVPSAAAANHPSTSANADRFFPAACWRSSSSCESLLCAHPSGAPGPGWASLTKWA